MNLQLFSHSDKAEPNQYASYINSTIQMSKLCWRNI